MNLQPLLSPKKQARIKRDKKIRAEQRRLFRELGAVITTINELLMKKYKLRQSTIRTICQAQQQSSISYSTAVVVVLLKPIPVGIDIYK